MFHAYPTGVFSCVIDSYDIFHACDFFCSYLREAIESRDGVVVLRPDSGDPVEVVTKLLDILYDTFPGDEEPEIEKTEGDSKPEIERFR